MILEVFIQIKHPFKLAPKKKCRGRDGGPNGSPDSDGQYAYWCGGRHDSHHGPQGGDDGNPLEHLYGAGLDSSSPSEFVWKVDMTNVLNNVTNLSRA